MLKAGHLTELITVPDPNYPTMSSPDKQPALVDLREVMFAYPYGHDYCTLRFRGVDQYIVIDMTYESFKGMLREQDAINAITEVSNG